MNIIFLYISLPHLSESGVFIDLIKEFTKQGHNVKVATPSTKGADEGMQLEAGIEVLRFKTDQLTRNSSNIQKGIAYIQFTYQILFAIRKNFRKQKFDLIISHSLPPEIAIVIKILKKKHKAKFYLMLCEYIWQDSVSLGFIKKGGLIHRYYQYLEKTLIKAADFVGSPSQGNIDFTLKYHPWAKYKNMHVLHYSQSPIKLTAGNEDIKAKYNLTNKFVVIYGGNMSIAQKIENVIDLAESCLDYKEIVFLLLGRGPVMDTIKEYVKKKLITNIDFIDFMPKNEYNLLLSACDVGLVSLNEKLAIPNIPSKTLSYFNLSIPVVASIDAVTDYGIYLEKAGAGLWSYAGDTKKFKENLLKLYSSAELRKQMGQNAYQFYLNHMLPEKAYQTIIQQIKNS
jgi:glycosyltransferase involved in cell wall biosynthesis